MLKKYKYIIVGSVTILFISMMAYAADSIFRQFSSTSGVPHISWHFYSDGSGNAGIIDFTYPGTKAGKDGYFLTGTFWIETIWTGTFAPGTMLIAPTTRLDDPWTINGTIDSNAWPIYLTGVRYLPNENILAGSGWNNGIGYVPFWSGVGMLGSVTNTGIAQWFIGRVKILGTLDGNKAFETFNNSIGIQYNASLMNQILNRIRKNVSLLTRNMNSGFANSFSNTSPTALGNKIFYINNANSAVAPLYSSSIDTSFPTSTIDSLILIWWDIVIDEDLKEPLLKKYPKGVIVLKNEKGVGGNIYITPAVKVIESSLFAEGTIYSWSGAGDIANATIQQVASLPENQLYVHGSIMSRNTIGGAVESSAAVCPYNEIVCNYTSAIKFDFNYFRNYLSGGTLATTRAYPDSTYDNYSMIIEYDSRISTNPPPWFENK